MAEQRSLEINVISAKDLQDVNLVTKMDVYAVVSISGDPKSRQKVKTDVDRGCGTNPTWNFPVKLSVDKSLAQTNRLTLVFRLVCDRSLGDKDVGEVNVPVKELLDSVNAAGEGSSFGGGGVPMKFVSYQVRKPSGKAKGELNFSYRFSEKVAGKLAAGEPIKESPACPAAAGSLYPPPPVVAYDHAHGPPPPVVAYDHAHGPPPPVVAYDHAHGPPPITGYAGYGPPPAQPSPYGGVTYPPPPTGYGYGYGYAPPPTHPPPPTGYGYGYQVPPPPPGYGYGYAPPPQPPVAPPRNNKSKLGLGLGAGLVGGVLGGMLIGDVVSDVASYDAGFGDVGGFDF